MVVRGVVGVLVAGLAGLAGACLVENPGYEGESMGSTTASVSTTGTTEPSMIDASSASAGTGSASEGTGSGGVGTSLVGGLSFSGGDGTTDVGTSSGTGGGTTAVDTGTSTGDPPADAMTLSHYAPGACQLVYGCYSGKYPAPARTWSIECFDSPLSPPFVATRVGVGVGDLNGSPPTEIKFYRFQDGTMQLDGNPFAVRGVGSIGATGLQSFVMDPPVQVDDAAFCVGAVGMDEATQLLVGIDVTSPNGGKSFFQMTAAGMGCDTGTTLLEKALGETKASWCIEVDVAPL